MLSSGATAPALVPIEAIVLQIGDAASYAFRIVQTADAIGKGGKKESAGGTGAFGKRKNGGENQDFGSRSARSASPGYSARNSDSPIRKRVRRGEEARTASMSARVFTPESEMSVVVSGK